MRFIPDGPPVINSVTHTDEPGIEARVLCLVDGFPAEIHHEVNTKRQEYNRHHLDVFDPIHMTWNRVLGWGFTEAGHVPIHPESETLGHLRGLSEVMWNLANVVVTQSRQRQEQVDTAQYAADRMEYRRQRDAYDDAKYALLDEANRAAYEAAVAADADELFPIVDRGEIDFAPANGEMADELAARVAESRRLSEGEDSSDEDR